MSQDNIIYIGRKPAMSYVMATLATFNNNETVHLKARGRAITTAVDVAEITRNRYMTEMEHPVITIGTEQVEDDRGTRNVSTMTIVMNKGLEIAPRRDETRILAVHAGKVVYADYFAGYGNLLIVDHGLSYFSLYGHCSEFLVAVGDMVAAGQPIALVGDSGSLNGECLYFEIRQKAKALDPLAWLKPGRE